MISLILLRQIRDQTLAISQSIYHTLPNHPSSEDELKWIDVIHNQSLAKEYVMSQSLNCMDGR